MLRKILAVLGGAIDAFVVVFLVEWVGHRLFPFPADLEMTDFESIRAFMESAPPSLLLPVLLAHFLGTACGGITATWIAQGDDRPAWIVCGVVMLAGIMNLSMIPHPTWFAVADLVSYPLGIYLGIRSIAARASKTTA